MTDSSLLANPVFLIPCVANMFAVIGLFIPFVYIVDRAVALGIQPENAAFLISVIGQCMPACLCLSLVRCLFLCVCLLCVLLYFLL